MTRRMSAVGAQIAVPGGFPQHEMQQSAGSSGAGRPVGAGRGIARISELSGDPRSLLRFVERAIAPEARRVQARCSSRSARRRAGSAAADRRLRCSQRPPRACRGGPRRAPRRPPLPARGRSSDPSRRRSFAPKNPSARRRRREAAAQAAPRPRRARRWRRRRRRRRPPSPRRRARRGCGWREGRRTCRSPRRRYAASSRR